MATTPTNNFDFQNYYSATLQSDITASSLTLTLDTVPTPVEGILVIDPDSTTNREIIFYTGKTSSTITLPSDGRGWDGTTATSHLTGTTIIMAPVAYMLRMLKSGSLYDTTKTGWTTLGQAPTYVQHNGQKEYILSTSSDLTGVVTPGMKLRFDRPAGTPTQSIQFVAASSQYASKASPAGFSFTDNFTIEAWVYVDSYSAGTIISKYDGSTGGFIFDMQPDGRLRIWGKATGLTNDELNSYQSIPLGKWTHVAGNMTLSTGTGTLYIDGVAVPSVYTNGTSTAITQTGNLQMGAYNGATNPLNGKVSNARVWSTVRTAAQIRDNMSNILTGSETGLVFYCLGNGNFNDLTVNANSLTPSGGAIATYAGNPFSPTEYLIATNITSSQITAFAGSGGGIPSIGVLANFYYSTARAPYGFPVDSSRWSVVSVIGSGPSWNISAANTWYESGILRLVVPTGAWRNVGYSGAVEVLSGAAIQIDGRLKVATALPVGDDSNPLGAYLYSDSVSTQYFIRQLHVRTPLSIQLASQTTYNVYGRLAGVNTSSMIFLGTTSYCHLIAECAYL
jgi:hypothetical protein